MSQEQSNAPGQPATGGQDQAGKVTRPTPPQRREGEGEPGHPLSELDEGVRPAPDDDIQQALFDAAQGGMSGEIDFDELPGPDLREDPAQRVDDIQAVLSTAARKGVLTELDFEDLPEPLPELDEGPHSGPVDDIQDALFDAIQAGTPTELEFDELPKPMPDLDEGPRPGPVDDIQDALFGAAQVGLPTEVDFDDLPPPGQAPVKKVIRFRQKDTPTQPTPVVTKPSQPVEDSAAVPLPDFPEPEPAPPISDFWLLLALFVSFRVLTLFLFQPGGFVRDWSDFDTYLGMATASDYSQLPFFDFWLEWPPLLPWLAVGAYKLSLLLPPWPDDPRLWFVLILGAVFVLFEVGNFVLIYRLARRLFQTPVTISRVLWLYTGLFPPIYAMLGFFDGIALFFMLLALELLLAERRFPSAVAVGAGFMVKIIPVLMLPVALRRLWAQHRQNSREAGVELGLYSVIFGLAVLVLLAPFLIGGPEWVLASARSMLGRSSWETVWAVAEGYYGFGEVAGDRTNPAETNFAVHQGGLSGWRWGLITLFFASIYGYLFTRPADYTRPRNVIAFTGLTVAIFLLYTKGYSPQFLIYLLPFILLLFPDWHGLTYALILTSLNVLEQPIYFVLLPNQTWLLVFVVVARFLVISLLALEFALVIWSTAEPLAGLVRVRQQTPQFLASLALLAMLVLIPLLLGAYKADRLAESPVAAFTGFMKIQAKDGLVGEEASSDPAGEPRLLLSDPATYRQIYPYLNHDFDLQLTGGVSQGYPNAPRTVDLLQDFETIWILPTGSQQQALSNTVAGRGQSLASFEFAGLGTASLYSFEANIPPFIAPARFSNGVELLAHQVEVERGAVTVTLYWRALNPQTQSLTAFTQLLNSDGQWVAGHDSIPRNGTAPTTDWTIDAVQMDPHRIELPADLPAGNYTLIVGLYNQFNDRLRAIAPNGFSFTNQAVPLLNAEGQPLVLQLP